MARLGTSGRLKTNIWAAFGHWLQIGCKVSGQLPTGSRWGFHTFCMACLVVNCWTVGNEDVRAVASTMSYGNFFDGLLLLLQGPLDAYAMLNPLYTALSRACSNCRLATDAQLCVDC